MTQIHTCFPAYVSSRRLMRFVTRYELMKRIVKVPGDIVVCGIYEGFDYFSFMKIHAELEGRSRYRALVGFDTFSGYTEFSDHDNERSTEDPDIVDGGCHADYEEFLGYLEYSLEALGTNSPNVAVRVGDIAETGPAYLAEYPETVVALLYLDMNLYEPTKAALELFEPRVPKGGIIATDCLTAPHWPGAAEAFVERRTMSKCKLRKFEWESNLTWWRV